MANFVVVIDPDRTRRIDFVKKIKPLVSIVDELSTNVCSSGDFCSVWSASVRAPVSYVTDDKGAAVLWGDAIGESNSARIDAARLRTLWSDPNYRSKAVFDGFYAGVVYDVDTGFVAGADLLGMFPVYYWNSGDVLLMGSSPELFRYHPAFRIEFNPAGLVAIALTMHIFDGQTLLKDLRRLSAGHLFLWQPPKAPAEHLQYKIAVSERYFSLPFSAHVDILDQVVDKTITRHAPTNHEYSLMLSGGLDSRMLAGYLSKKGVSADALTMGMSTDLEMRCAIPVAKILNLAHHPVDVPFDQYALCASLQADWEHLSNGFNNICNWGIHSLLKGFAPRVIVGHTTDAVIGTRYINWAYSPSSHTMSFDTFFANLNSWGIRPSFLKRLLRRKIFGDLVDQTISRIRVVYESYSDIESQRAWCFNLYNRQRFHVAGAAWPMSFGAWPVIMALDRRFLETAGGMPASTIAERRAETELVCKRFPALAALPLDRNSYNTKPLQPRLRYQVSRYFYNHLRPLGRLAHLARNGKPERRYYVRIYDFNNSGWLAVRHQAEAYRQRLFNIFNKDVLDELLPSPEVPIHFTDTIVKASGLKILLGLMLWSENHSF
jgi:asparagine synthase (glutamine-hydrolysing)